VTGVAEEAVVLADLELTLKMWPVEQVMAELDYNLL
jgi:hypothetical protein